MLTKTYPNSMHVQPEDERGFDLREMIGFVWRQWKFIASVVVATLIIAAVYVWSETPRYTASALVLLEPQTDRIPGADAPYNNGNFLDVAVIESQLAIIKSTTFLRRVVERTNLVSDPEFGSRSPKIASSQTTTGSVTSEASAAAKTQQPAAEDANIPPDVMASIQRLGGAIGVGRAGQGYILSISVTSVDPDRAARLANAVADAYVVEKLDARYEAAKRGSAWLSDRLVDLRKQLHDSEEAVADFRKEHGFVQSNTNVTLNQQQLSELNAKLLAARAETADKKARVDLLNSIEAKGGNVQSLPDLANSPTLTALRQQEVTISQKEADLIARYNDRHPLVVNVRAEHNDIKRAIASEAKRLAANFENDYELAKAREASLERTVQEVTGQSGADDRTAITLRELERTAAVNKSLFENFLQKAKISEQQSTFEARDARVITPALRAGAPSSPRIPRTMEFALMIGLVLGIGGSVAKDKLNGGFATPRQIEDMLELPLLASMNTMLTQDRTVKGKVLEIPHYISAMPLSRFSESVRALRSGIKMTDVDHPPKVVLVTSTIPNEGKTTVALSLAVSAATAGLKVLVVDGDLRHTSISRFFGLLKHPGLVDHMLGNATVQEAIIYDENAKLWVLAAGSKTRNPADLIASDRMKSFMEVCKQSFDFVVVDAPPIGPVIDALMLTQLADKVVYVVRWASTSRELVQQSVQRLPRDKLAGTVFNRVNEKAAQKYGKYAYQYYHGARDYKKYYSG
jgi:capsular exopolysaccharide synthesis family protein